MIHNQFPGDLNSICTAFIALLAYQRPSPCQYRVLAAAFSGLKAHSASAVWVFLCYSASEKGRLLAGPVLKIRFRFGVGF